MEGVRSPMGGGGWGGRGSWGINQQTIMSTTGASRCCSAERRGKLVCARSSWGSRPDDLLASYLVGVTLKHFKLSVTIGIFS